VRMPDQPTALERSVAFAALLQTMCAHFADGDGTPADRGVYQQNRWAALRFGADAQFLHPDEDRQVGVGELAGELLERLASTADKLDTTALIAGFEHSAVEGARQLEVGRERGLYAVAADVVERTLVS
jgi:gamma-glutamyl:cysteine ligase YbdK (ATP-grasp superfamily)